MKEKKCLQFKQLLCIFIICMTTPIYLLDWNTGWKKAIFSPILKGAINLKIFLFFHYIKYYSSH